MNIGLAIVLICLALFVGFSLGAIVMSDKLKDYSIGTLYVSKNKETYLELKDPDVLEKKRGYASFFVSHMDK